LNPKGSELGVGVLLREIKAFVHALCRLPIGGIVSGLGILVASSEGFYNWVLSNSLANQVMVD
jgi:hypothetical protein